MSKYERGWAERTAKAKDRRERRARQALAAARRCAQVLHDKFHVQAVYLIGSLTAYPEVREHSDIDLVVQGLPPESYVTALTKLYRCLPRGMDLDLVPYEDAPDEMKERAHREGVLLVG